MIECLGLNIKLDFDSMITYRVFFYDVNGDFLSSTSSLDSDFDSAPTIARYCRIVITPKEDTEIKWYEINKYAKQITISVDSKQDFPYIAENDIFSLYGVNYTWDDTCTQQIEFTGKFASNRMNVAGKSTVVLILPNDAILGLNGFFASGNVVISNVEFAISENINGMTVFSAEIPENATTFAICGNGAFANEIQVFAI